MTSEEMLRNWHVAALLDEAGEVHGDRPFIVGPATLTYRDAARQSRSLNRLMAQGWVVRRRRWREPTGPRVVRRRTAG
jgi:hypothetical protein